MTAEDDDAERTTSIGLYNYAGSYSGCAHALARVKPRGVTHPDEPINFLFYHSIELYLKAYLRFKGHTPKELASRKFWHDFGALTERAVELGLILNENDKTVLEFMRDTDAVLRARYIKVGAARRMAHLVLLRASRSLRQSVGEALLEAGEPVRGIAPRPRQSP
jgi:hypothetical protein